MGLLRTNTAADVSVVIPTTLTRNELLRRAISSAREQHSVHVEIIVVADVEPTCPLPALGDDVRVLKTPDGPCGPGIARNVGAAAAVAPWVAFLDDDDTWAPPKLARQVDVGQRFDSSDVVVGVSCRRIVDGHARVVPRRLPGDSDDVSEWWYCRHTLTGGTGACGLSVVLTSRDLLERCPFNDHPNWEDLDWLLRVTRRHGARYVHVPEPLANVFVDSTRGRRGSSNRTLWTETIDWIEANPDLFTPASAAGAVLNRGSQRPGAVWRFPHTIRTAFRLGRPRLVDLVASAAATARRV